jgi:hypothetical protein
MGLTTVCLSMNVQNRNYALRVGQSLVPAPAALNRSDGSPTWSSRAALGRFLAIAPHAGTDVCADTESTRNVMQAIMDMME